MVCNGSFHSMQSFIFFIPRPTEGEKHLKPDVLHKYRESHTFLGPCCLCPLRFGPLKKDGEPCFVEAAIYMPSVGHYAGEYVAECSKSRCGYLGLSLFSIKAKKNTPS